MSIVSSVQVKEIQRVWSITLPLFVPLFCSVLLCPLSFHMLQGNRGHCTYSLSLFFFFLLLPLFISLNLSNYSLVVTTSPLCLLVCVLCAFIVHSLFVHHCTTYTPELKTLQSIESVCIKKQKRINVRPSTFGLDSIHMLPSSRGY